MIQLVLGGIIFLLGLPFFIRGWIFFLKPDSTVSQNARERNLRLGMETDMKKWGRKVRRFGFLLLLVGGGLLYWGASSQGWV